jgi:hypothetical protein
MYERTALMFEKRFEAFDLAARPDEASRCTQWGQRDRAKNIHRYSCQHHLRPWSTLLHLTNEQSCRRSPC